MQTLATILVTCLTGSLSNQPRAAGVSRDPAKLASRDPHALPQRAGRDDRGGRLPGSQEHP